jgi:hypothetical protein
MDFNEDMHFNYDDLSLDDENSLACYTLGNTSEGSSNNINRQSSHNELSSDDENSMATREGTGNSNNINRRGSHIGSERDRYCSRDCASSEEVVVIAQATILPGEQAREEMCILIGKLRITKVLQQPEAQWAEQSVRRCKYDGMLRIMSATSWQDLQSFQAYFLTPDSLKYYTDNFQMAVKDSFQIEQYARVFNPFGHVNITGQKRSLTDMEEFPETTIFNPFEIQPYALCVIIKLTPDPTTIADFEQILWSSEACARQVEEGCLRYEVLTPLKETDKDHEELVQGEGPITRDFAIFAVFQTEIDFHNHSSKGCSLLGDRAKSLCLLEPMVSIYTKTPLAISKDIEDGMKLC